MGYIYAADVYCDDCGAAIRAALKAQGKAPEDELDHYSYDSDDYPKDAPVEREESDSPNHCAKCETFLHNPLTSEGYKYIQSALNDLPSLTSLKALREGGHAFLADWANWYGFTYWTAEDCADDGRHDKAGWYSNESY